MHQISPSGQMSSFSPTFFSLSVSNGKLEQTFSKANLIKSSKLSSLCTDMLSNLLVINADMTSLKEFLQILLSTYGGMHKKQTSQAPSSVDSDSDDEAEVILDDWSNA